MELLAAEILSPRKRKRAENCKTAKAIKYFTKIQEIVTNVFEQSDEIGASSETNCTPKKKTHICNLCNTKLNATTEWNLVNHISKCHKDIYEEISIIEKEPFPVTRLRVLQNCTETVSVNGRPFEWIHDSGYRKQFQSILDELAAANLALNLSEPLKEVKEHLKKTANQIREKIKNEVKDRPLSLLVDLVTKHKRSILGVSVQYTFEGDLKVRSIGFIELTERHTGQYLSEVIIKRLTELGITLLQIFTITTDNAKNVLKLVRDMSDCLEAELNKAKQKTKENKAQRSESHLNNASQNDDELIDLEISELLTKYAEVNDNVGDDDDEEEDALDRAMNEVQINGHETLLEAMTYELHNCGDIMWNITGINCAAHLIQLAIKGAIEKLPTSTGNVISLCREMSKFLRKISTKNEMAQLNIEYRLPRLEVSTRWSSMYYMVNNF